MELGRGGLNLAAQSVSPAHMLKRFLPSLLGSSTPVRPVAHRKLVKHDVEHMRWAGDGKLVMPSDNPGIRVEPSFVTDVEGAAIAAEITAAADAYGYPYDGDTRVHVMSASGNTEATVDGIVNNLRVTGRQERPDVQELPPCGYGDSFDASALPPSFAALAHKIETCGAFCVGALRDVTINVRDNAFFQLDPHLDPALDGPDVFILGLESSVVLSFTPPDEVLGAMGRPKRRSDPREIGLKSWSDLDVDVLFQPRSLVHFTGAARSSWMHAIRAGVQVDGQAPDGGPVACDWWGTPDYLVRREPTRLSLVLAFGEPKPA